VGGIVTGQELIKAATIRSLIKQQEQFKTAAATVFVYRWDHRTQAELKMG
jgi:hypothetical protein